MYVIQHTYQLHLLIVSISYLKQLKLHIPFFMKAILYFKNSCSLFKVL